MANPIDENLSHAQEYYVLNSNDTPMSVMFDYNETGELVAIQWLPKSVDQPFSLENNSEESLLSYDTSLGRYYLLQYQGKQLYRQELDQNGAPTQSAAANQLAYEKYDPKTQQWVAEKSDSKEAVIQFNQVDDFDNRKKILSNDAIQNKYHTHLNYLKNTRSPLSWLADLFGYNQYSKDELAQRKEASIEFLAETFGYELFPDQLKQRQKADKNFSKNANHFNSLVHVVNEKVRLFQYERKDGLFTKYDIQVLHVLEAAIKKREEEYQRLLQRQKDLEALLAYGTEKEKKQKSTIEKIFNEADITFANESIKNEQELIKQLLAHHKSEYEQLEKSKKQVSEWLQAVSKKEYNPMRGQTFAAGVDEKNPTAIHSGVTNDDLPSGLSTFVVQHGRALEKLCSAYMPYSPKQDNNEQEAKKFTEKDLVALSNGAIFDLANSKGNYIGGLSQAGWSYDSSKKTEDTRAFWIQHALISAYLNNDKIYLSGGWAGDDDKQFVEMVFQVAIAAFGAENVFTGPTSITTARRKEIEKSFKESNYKLERTDLQNIANQIHKTLGLTRKKDQIVRSGQDFGLHKKEAKQVFAQVKEALHPDEGQKKGFKIS